MFTGIIESLGKVRELTSNGTNRTFYVESPVSQELKVDQSVSHNGVCLTVENILEDNYEVVAVEETLKRTNLGKLKTGDLVNLERSMKLGDRLDGHLVQGHVDETAFCAAIEDRDGSWLISFAIDIDSMKLVIEKGSICINGVSLTVVDTTDDHFSVAIIPYTYENTNFKTLKVGDSVNIEFDVIGKYVQRMMEKMD